MADLFLIAHKVRGDVGFDIATKLEVPGDSEIWWIISTSGHRAYPIMWWDLGQIALDQNCEWPSVIEEAKAIEFNPEWPKLRDHYETTASVPRASGRPSVPARTPTLDDI